MKQIPYIDVMVRDHTSFNNPKVIQSYPFPDVDWDVDYYTWIVTKNPNDALFEFHKSIQEIADPMTRLATLTRFKFILEVWHPNNFVKISLKPWKYL